jgi:hypothetical protein
MAVPRRNVFTLRMLVIRRGWRSVGGSSPINSLYAGQTTTTYWYAPAARAVVKSVHHNPYQGTTTVELVSFQPGR